MSNGDVKKSRPLYGLILAGGKSSRMGYDKSLIEFHHKPQREYLFDLLARRCEKVFLSCKEAETIPAKFNPLPDKFEIESPLNGILSAMSTYPDIAWLVVATDMPMVDAGVLAYLLDNRDPKKAATCFFDSDGKDPEPLLSVWEPKALALLHIFYEEKKISPRDFLKKNDVKLLLPLSDQMNINTPEELRRYRGNP